jgi:holo-[acyl-carrier protein] synthase|tara:strand:- start:26 stop:379 length:354 start_codon:yes stop_codon:yes gene_type:complete
MIEKFGIGIDISNIENFKNKTFKNNKTFYEKLFSNEEILYCTKFKNSAEKFTGKFAVKEALIKSINKKIHFLDIETSYYNSKPIVKLAKSRTNYNFIVSLSHDSNLAVAVVISEEIK